MEQLRPETQWSVLPLWQTPTVLQTTLIVTLVGPISMASIDCLTISGDDPLAIEAWQWQLASLNAAVESSIAVLRAELDRAIDSLSPF